jgi:hypothetical protein
MAQDHWLSGFNYNVEEWFEDLTTAHPRPRRVQGGGRGRAIRLFHDPQPHRVVKRYPEGDW